MSQVGFLALRDIAQAYGEALLQAVCKTRPEERDACARSAARQLDEALRAAMAGQRPERIVVTEAMHRAAVKVLLRAHGLDGLPQRMLDAMLAHYPAKPPTPPANGSIRVACITLDGATLTMPAETITDFGIGEDDGHTYALTFKTMTRAEYEALGEFDGF